ncbi:MAG: Trk family potassium uptake protein [Clostridia bacterium]|nr:Trk family potassium uptake protein [Clostridia bacterium]
MTKPLKKQHRRLSAFQYIVIGFAGVILAGTLLLMLPVASQSRTFTPFGDALFTAVSATCVTGLVVRDTASTWSYFGQAVILILIQIGGLGVVTVAASLSMISGRKINLLQRSTMMESISANQVGGIVKITLFVIRTALAVELSGALLLLAPFIKTYGTRGIWKAFFVSISAFCNAGFDLMGTSGEPFQSIVSFGDNPAVIIVVILLIVIGGIGFFTWDDFRENGIHLKRFRMQSKVILITSAVLIVLPSIWFFFVDFSDMTLRRRILVSLFQAVTPRTAGFNSVDFSALTGGGRAIMTVLMLIGGAPGSTAGGMKVTTIAVLFANMSATFTRKNDGVMLRRRIEPEAVKRASTVLTMYLTAFISSAIAISQIEGIPLYLCLFETASAVGTVGLTLGITPSLHIASRIILMILMYLGRVGALTLIYAALPGSHLKSDNYPREKITVG